MKTSKILVVFILITVLLAQVGAVFAAPANETTVLTGEVKEITVETDVNTGVITVLVTIMDENENSQTVRISQQTASDLGLLIPDINGGIPVMNPGAVGSTILIDPATVIADDEADRHPVGDALATFFSEITVYETIMQAHEEGAGFGVIAQALWLTQKLEGDSDTFVAILLAKETGNFDEFALEDGTTPKNWGQFRKAILNGDKKGNLGIVMSNKDHNNNGNGNNGNGNGNGNNGNGNNGNGNGNNGNNGNGNDK